MNKTIFNMKTISLWNKCHFGLNVIEMATKSPAITTIARFSTKDPKKSEALKARQEELMRRSLPKRKSIPGVDNVILVSSGKGGVGKSTVSVNIAAALMQHKSNPAVGILDADLFGPSLPTMMNVSGLPELTPQNNMIPLVNFGIKCMSMGLLVDPKNAVVWRGPMVMGALNKLLNETDWGSLDFLVVDTPPGTGDVLLSLAQTIDIAGAIVVSTPQKVAQIDAVKGIDMFKKVHVPVLGLVENMSGFVCGSCGHITQVFGSNDLQSLVEGSGAEIIGKVPLDPGLVQSSDNGQPLVLSFPDSAPTKEFHKIADIIVNKLSSN
eukprot:TRINITY_DN29062_c0_g1_i10.p1 TRINITY_DN29062_c0_g1~~TRINITY_DN29062_c0_g1_i10.p1  ORF type:complete len:323 (-),score=44.39 TRINITY_DN29062_c0_g1_i10:137-1105(-)